MALPPDDPYLLAIGEVRRQLDRELEMLREHRRLLDEMRDQLADILEELHEARPEPAAPEGL